MFSSPPKGAWFVWSLFLTSLSLAMLIGHTALADEVTNDNQEASVVMSADEGLLVTSADGDYSLRVRSRFQLRYLLETDGSDPQHSSFYLRRLQPDIQGHAFSEDLTFRLMPDFSRTASLRDGWVSYRFHDAFQLRAGQFNVPFTWERHLPPTRQQFVERSVANNHFQWPTGRDLGLMVHGNPLDNLRYGVSVVSGQGINAARSETAGHAITGRVVFTPAGRYETSEVLIRPAEDLNLSIGGGGYFAFDSTAREWNLWDGAVGTEADVWGATTDVHLRWSRLSMHLAGFFRDVRPDTAEMAAPIQSYDGFGYTAHAGVLVVPELLFASVRHSATTPVFRDDVGRQMETLGGLQFFHRGHASKLHLESGVRSDHDGHGFDHNYLVQLQYQFLF